jgi:hypothetical protein
MGLKKRDAIARRAAAVVGMERRITSSVAALLVAKGELQAFKADMQADGDYDDADRADVQEMIDLYQTEIAKL